MMTMKLILFCLPYILAVNGLCSSSFLFLNHRNCCYCGNLVVNSYEYLLIGEYLNLTCSLDSGTVEKGNNSSDIVFTLSDDHEIEPSVSILNRSTSQLFKKIETIADGGNYYCKLREKEKDLIEAKSIEVEYPPHTVQNFTCFFFDWDEYMECTWDLGVPYKHKNALNISLYMEDGYCNNMRPTGCLWAKNEGINFDREFYNFTVKVMNKKRQLYRLTENLIINYIENVKPSKVDSFEVEAENSTCVTLQWFHPRSDKYKEFVITSTSKWNDTRVFHTAYFNKTICNLIPHTKYEFSIETIPGRNLGIPSDIVQNSTYTLKDRPFPPEIVDNTYFVQKENCIQDKRVISVQWKEVPAIHRNGPLIGYFVEVNGDDGSYNKHEYINDTSQLQFSVQIPCRPMIFSLRSWGEEGLSTESSQINIPEPT